MKYKILYGKDWLDGDTIKSANEDDAKSYALRISDQQNTRVQLIEFDSFGIATGCIFIAVNGQIMEREEYKAFVLEEERQVAEKRRNRKLIGYVIDRNGNEAIVSEEEFLAWAEDHHVNECPAYEGYPREDYCPICNQSRFYGHCSDCDSSPFILLLEYDDENNF